MALRIDQLALLGPHHSYKVSALTSKQYHHIIPYVMLLYTLLFYIFSHTVSYNTIPYHTISHHIKLYNMYPYSSNILPHPLEITDNHPPIPTHSLTHRMEVTGFDRHRRYISELLEDTVQHLLVQSRILYTHHSIGLLTKTTYKSLVEFMISSDRLQRMCCGNLTTSGKVLLPPSPFPLSNHHTAYLTTSEHTIAQHTLPRGIGTSHVSIP